MSIDKTNKQQLQAYELIETTNSSFFLTGKAGTGKTTFLQTVQKEIDKNFIVLAPTGIAAMLAGGETIHSFFWLASTNMHAQDDRECQPLQNIYYQESGHYHHR